MRKSIGSVLLLAAFVACTTDKGSAGGDAGGTMIIVQPIEGNQFFPPYVADNAGRLIQDLVFDRLAEISDDLRTVGDKTFTPRLAEKWTWAPDSLSIAFSIKPNARWHDGKPVTASDVRYSFKMYTDTAVGSSVGSSLMNVDSVSVRDSLTAVAWFKRHTPDQFYDFVYQVVVLPEHVYGAIPVKDLRASDAATHPIGSGRFRLSKYEAGVRLELLADTANYRGRPKLDRVVIVRSDPAASIAKLKAGEADFLEQFPLDQMASLDSNANARGVIVPGMGYGYFAMNLHAPKSKSAPHPLFGDVRVRRAMSMGVDRAAIVKNVFGERGVVSHGPFVMKVSFADSTLKLPPYDTTGARALLDSAGWTLGANGVRAKGGKPLHFTILATTSSAPRLRIAVLVQEQLRKIGAQVEIEQLDFTKYVPRFLSSDYDASVAGFIADPSVTGAVQQWGTEAIGQQNTVGYSNKRVDALLDSAAHTFDTAKQNQYASRAFQQIVDDAPGIWLYDVIALDAVNRRFTTAPMRSDGWWAHLDEWSVPASKRIDRDRIGLTPAKP